MRITQGHHSSLQVLYLDIDTLWLAEPTFAWAHFQGMRQHGALFGMAEETSDKNEAGNWYRGGEATAHVTSKRSSEIGC